VSEQTDWEVELADLLFGVPALIAYMSQVITLLPGDVIATGSPSGVGGLMKPPRFLKPAYARKDAPWQFSDWATSESGSTTSRR
jgi:hypothetical protein